MFSRCKSNQTDFIHKEDAYLGRYDLCFFEGSEVNPESGWFGGMNYCSKEYEQVRFNDVERKEMHEVIREINTKCKNGFDNFVENLVGDSAYDISATLFSKVLKGESNHLLYLMEIEPYADINDKFHLVPSGKTMPLKIHIYRKKI